MFDGLHFAPMAGWQSGYAAVCNTVYAGSIPTPASINFFFANRSAYKSSEARSYGLKTPAMLLIRHLLGFSGNSLTAEAVGSEATGTIAEEIESYIEARIPST